MSNETKAYDERAREQAKETAGLLAGEPLETVEETVFIMLKLAYADGVIDQLRENLK